MGVVYQAVLVRGTKSQVRDAIRDFPQGTIQLRSKNTLGIVLLPLEPQRGFLPSALTLAEHLSIAFGSSLFVQYDDRIGLREAVIFHEGRLAQRFGATDELWVPLDDNGDPRRDSLPVRIGQLVCGEEYETSVTAIDRGLEVFGVNPPFHGAKLRDLVLKADG